MQKCYYGAETRRALKNFPLTQTSVNLKYIYAMAQIKIAAAEANFQLHKLDEKIYQAICSAAQEILAGKLDDQFVTDQIQGGAGTSMHMNINEVIAARANEILKNDSVHYLDHVNMSQSTNDVVPTAIRIVLLQEIQHYLQALATLEKTCQTKAKEFAQVLKVGRTHLQDAVPITLGQEFQAYAAFLQRDQLRLQQLEAYLVPTNLGGTAIGTGVNSSQKFVELAHQSLAKLTGLPLRPADDLIDATQNVDVFSHVASLLQLSAVGLSKICSDLRLLASGPQAGLAELKLPEMQKGSTIMPNKVNPVILEVMNQISFQATGNALVASLVLYHGQLELNVMLPVYMKTVVETLQILTNGVAVLSDYLLASEANPIACQKWFAQSYCTATALTPALGYDKVEKLIKESLTEQVPFLTSIQEKKVISKKALETLLHPQALTTLK